MKLTHNSEHLLSLDDIIARSMTKGELAQHHYGERDFDSALPQDWLNRVADAADWMTYSEILATTVWMYPTKTESARYWLGGIPAPLCEDTARELDRQGIAYWSPRGYHGQPHSSAQ